MRKEEGVFTDKKAETGLTASMPRGIEHVAHDFNNDGYVDIDINGSTMLLNNGDMTFTHSSVAMGNGAVGDLDNDGYLDVVDGGSVYINQEDGNNYLKVNLIGVESNKNGIGARITITSNLGTQIRDVRAGDGFRHMSSITAHFGLGQDEIVEEMVINWPSGTETTLENVYTNNTLDIVEVEGNVVSVEELLAEEFNIFPNPSSDFLNIDSEMNFNSFPVEVLTLDGRTVFSSLVKDDRVDISELSTGAYILRVQANDAFHQIQFIKE